MSSSLQLVLRLLLVLHLLGLDAGCLLLQCSGIIRAHVCLAGLGNVRVHLVKVEVTVGVGSGGIDVGRILLVLFRSGQLTLNGSHGRQLRGGEENVGALA